MQTHRILIVDTDDKMRRTLAQHLSQAGYRISVAADGAQAIEYVENVGVPDLVLLNVLLPPMGDLSLADMILRAGRTYIIFIVAVDEIDSVRPGLLMDADDHITVPLDLPTVLVRVRRALDRDAFSLHRREVPINSRLRVNFRQRYAIIDDERLMLTPIETGILRTLYAHRGKYVSAQRLLWSTTGYDMPSNIQSLWAHMRRLREKIEDDPSRPRVLLSMRGEGYQLAKTEGSSRAFGTFLAQARRRETSDLDRPEAVSTSR